MSVIVTNNRSIDKLVDLKKVPCVLDNQQLRYNHYFLTLNFIFFIVIIDWIKNKIK